jgi:hypothetical protein
MPTPSWHEQELLAELANALQSADLVPRDFVDAGKAALAWRTIYAELAALTYDSAANPDLALAATRAEPASLRALTFAAKELTIELEVSEDAIHGQLVPPCRGEIEVEMRDLTTVHATALADDVGYFVIRPVPMAAFRLRCHITGPASVLTGWIEV